MIFEYNATLYVDDEDIDEAVDLALHRNMTVQSAIERVTSHYDNSDYYNFKYIANDLFDEVNRRMKLKSDEEERLSKKKYCWRLNGNFRTNTDTYLWIAYDSRTAEISDCGAHLTESEYKRMSEVYKFPENMFVKVELE